VREREKERKKEREQSSVECAKGLEMTRFQGCVVYIYRLIDR